MRHTRSSLHAAVAVVVAVAASLVPHPSVADTSAPTVSFRVVEPDGSAVSDAVVWVSVFGPTAPYPKVASGGPLGEIVVPFPADDPVAARQLAAGEATTLLIQVFDKAPGSSDINAAYVTASIGPDFGGVVRELTRTSGKTYTLQPGRTAFTEPDAQTAAALDARIGLPGIGGVAPPQVPQCPGNEPKPYPCYITDIPSWTQHELVPIAENHGAGVDVVSSMRYHSSIVTQTSVALQVGAGGYFETGGTSAYKEETTETFGFADRGPSQNYVAQLDSSFERDRITECAPTDVAWHCQFLSSYRPYSANGSYSTSYPVYDDHMDVRSDCWAAIDKTYEPSSTSEDESTFSFRLGPDENFVDQGTMYANTTITQQTGTRKGFVRSWTAAPPASRRYRYQYVYVPGGKYLTADDGTGYDLANCVRDNLDKVLTESTDIDYKTMVKHSVDPQPDPPNPDDGTAPHTVCGPMPDRCD